MEIAAYEVLPGDLLDLVLLCKDVKTFSVGYYRPGIVKEEGFEDFLAHVKRVGESRLESLLLADLQRIYAEPSMAELDPLIAQFCEFMQVGALARAHAPEKVTPQLGRKPIKHPHARGEKSNKKGEGYYYFYQLKEGFNVFLHPLDVEYLLREAGYDFEYLRPMLHVS